MRCALAEMRGFSAQWLFAGVYMCVRVYISELWDHPEWRAEIEQKHLSCNRTSTACLRLPRAGHNQIPTFTCLAQRLFRHFRFAALGVYDFRR